MPARAPRTARRSPSSGLRGYARAALVIAATTAVATLARRIDLPDLAALFVLGVMLSALGAGRGPAVLAAALAVVAYDFLFVPPAFMVTLTNWRYQVTFATLFVVSLIVGGLTSRLQERERRTAALRDLAGELAAAYDEAGIAAAVERAASAAAGAEAFLVAIEPRGLRYLGDAGRTPSLGDADEAVVRRAVEAGAAPGGEGASRPGLLTLPLLHLPGRRVVLVVRPGAAGREARSLLEALARSAGAALDRVRLAEEARREELRTGLLSSLSHDLRTPLASITGAATALRQEAALDAGTRRELVESIVGEAARLERLVSSVLDMTRLDQGAVRVRREWVPADELVGSALTHLEAQLAGHTIRTALAPDLPLLSIDPVLLEQLLVNLLENAARHAPAGSEIAVAVRREGPAVALEVADQGPGLPPGEEDRVFERFYRGPQAGPGGVGLGLSIARAIAQVHGAQLTAASRPGGGAVFRLVLPLPAEAPPPARDAEGRPGEEAGA